MKRTIIIRKLLKAGFTLIEGGNHTKVCKDGRYVSAIPRHKEIGIGMVKAIEKQTGTKLK